MKVYVAGPMTGHPEMNAPAFDAAAKRLRVRGHEPENPADNGFGGDGMTWADYMRRDITQLLTCDGIATLPGWQEPRGAALEVHIARSLDLPVLSVDEWMVTKP